MGMSRRWWCERARRGDPGLGLKPGDRHHRAYVGPPEDYDLVSAMVFNLLTCIGLRQHHRVLDVGCGSLRAGRLLIPYLGRGNYIGIEPNRWLVREGIDNELGRDLVRLRQPRFSFRDSMEEFEVALELDYAIAQSIFSHCGQDLIRRWLSQLAAHLKGSGALVATFVSGPADHQGGGWVYPGCVSYRPETMAALAAEAGLGFMLLDWAHPRQSWALLYKPGYDRSPVVGGAVSWNRMLAGRRGSTAAAS
jgi:SAM-dependent methyltransferase